MKSNNNKQEHLLNVDGRTEGFIISLYSTIMESNLQQSEGGGARLMVQQFSKIDFLRSRHSLNLASTLNLRLTGMLIMSATPVSLEISDSDF